MWRTVLTLLVVLLSTGCAAKRQAAELDLALGATEARTQVDLHLFGHPDERDPPDDEGLELGAPDPADVLRLLPVLEDVLLAYPEDVRTHGTKHIWLVGVLRSGGKARLGYAHPKHRRMEVALREGTTPAQLRGTLHHEIGHIVQGHPHFDREAWEALSAPESVGRRWRAWEGPGRPWLEAGFVSQYASKHPHEDFAELAELAFTHPDRVRRLAADHAAIAAKLAFLTAHYRMAVPDIVLPWDGAGWEAWSEAYPKRAGDTGR